MERITSQYLKKLNGEIRNVDNFTLLFEFYVTFSRFEFTLKSIGHLQKNDKNEARPDWNSFASKKKVSFDIYHCTLQKNDKLRESIDYILDNPPKKQFVESGQTTFRLAVDENPSTTQRLCTYITRIRNNLFHGAKFINTYGDTSREWELIECALIVLSYWIDNDHEFQSLYFEG